MPPQAKDPAAQTETAGEPNATTSTANPRGSREPEGQDIVGGTHDTTADISHRVSGTTTDFEVRKLERFLAARFPNEAIMTPSGPESAVDTAIRLLSKFATNADIQRCPESFCNKPAGHLDEHGWINRD